MQLMLVSRSKMRMLGSLLSNDNLMKLTLDTTDNLKTLVRLDDKEYETIYATPREQDVLGAIQKALSQSSHTLSNITEVEVNTGPGSFTGIRVGLTIAKTICMCLGLPLNNQPYDQVLPNYGKEASITKPKLKESQ